MEKFPKSSKLDHVCYDIRGPVHKKALQLEEEGNKILKLNIGNPAPFGFEAPDEILVDVIRNLPTSQGYCDSKGLYSARKAIVHYYQTKGLLDVTVNDVYIGNGVSELITMSMQALLNDGDEILIPAPDYPCGPPPQHWLAVPSAIIYATKKTTGSPTWPTWKPKLRLKLKPSLSSTPTTQQARCTAKKSCWKSPNWRVNTA